MKRLISIEVEYHEDTATGRRIDNIIALVADQYTVTTCNIYSDRLD